MGKRDLQQFLSPWVRRHPVLCGIAAIGSPLVMLVAIVIRSIGDTGDLIGLLKWVSTDWGNATLFSVAILTTVGCIGVPVIWGALGLPPIMHRSRLIPTARCGEWMDADTMGRCIRARLRVLNDGWRSAQACSAFVTMIAPIDSEGTVRIKTSPVKNLRQRLLWEAKQESVIIPPESTREIWIAEVQSSPAFQLQPSTDHALRICVEGTGKLMLCADWYKVSVRIESESDHLEPVELDLLLGWHPREGFPAPVELYLWSDRGERLVAALQRKAAEAIAKDAEREAMESGD